MAISETFFHYRVLEKLGVGGMGEVYRAKDKRLDRIVALKILLADVTSDPNRIERFIREAKTASALNHPNVAQIFEVGEEEGVNFIAMEFVEGETLRTRLKRPVALDETLDIAMQVAVGLAAAHRRGIIHRDLKPENIMLRVDGYVKLVDFGLAKILPWGQQNIDDRASTAQRTQTGQLVGTFNYMSPEQARGLPLTPASDVFSFGIVFYELLASEHPFRGETVMDTLNAILSKEPAPLSARCPAAPQKVSEVVTRTLQKEPSRRFTSAVDLVEELKGLRTPPAPLVIQPKVRQKPAWVKALAGALIAVLLALAGWSIWSSSRGGDVSRPVTSLAVMSFRATHDDSNASALAESLSEDLGGALSRAGLRVASRSIALGLPETTDPRIVGSQLGVDAVLEGSVRSTGNKVRVHIELINSRTGFQIYSETFTAEVDELLGSEPKTANEIATKLRGALTTR